MKSQHPFQKRIQLDMTGFTAELQRLCRQPSIAAQGVGMTEMARLVDNLFRRAGAATRVLGADSGQPVIYAEFPGRSDRTLLFYNHYDVQPPEPLNEWTVPPFSAEIRDGRLFARGASDNKGDLMARLAAVQVLQKVKGELPCRVKFVVEGEEETNSQNFHRVAARYADLLKADACIWEFGDRDQSGRVEIYAGVKGCCDLELSVQTANTDLHSSLGAIVENAAWRLTWALATLKGPSEEILVPGFFDGIQPPSAGDLEAARRIAGGEEEMRRLYGLRRFLRGREGGEGQAITADLLFGPTCTICGMESGYTGAGLKTVLPKEARAKLDFRLVTGQEPHDITEKVRRHLEASGFGDVKVEVLGEDFAYRTPVDDPFVRLVEETAREAYGAEALLYPTSSGSGPMYPLGKALHAPIVSTGIGYWGANAHAPDENIRLEDFAAGIYHICLLLERFGQAS